MKPFQLTTFSSGDELAQTAAGAWLDAIETRRGSGREDCVALSGGRIMQNFFKAVVTQSKSRGIALDHIHFFWADERCVPPTDPESNFRIAHQLLFEPLDITDSKIHRIRGEETQKIARQMAEMDLRKHAVLSSARQPILDLVFLGMGEDGHVASLFPGSLIDVNDIGVFIEVKESPKPPPNRISLTYRSIFDAKEVWVLVSGTGKEKAFRKSLAPDGITPLAEILKNRPFTRILTDASFDSSSITS